MNQKSDWKFINLDNFTKDWNKVSEIIYSSNTEWVKGALNHDQFLV